LPWQWQIYEKSCPGNSNLPWQIAEFPWQNAEMQWQIQTLNVFLQKSI
jgi:hypothetical protein